MVDFQAAPQPRYEAVGGWPLPCVKFVVYFSTKVEPGEKARILDVLPHASFMGMPLTEVIEETAPFNAGDIVGNYQRQGSYLVFIAPFLIERLEAKRTDDVVVSLSFNLRYFLDQSGTGVPQSTNSSLNFEISEAKWLKLLEALGYHGGWVIEIDRPEIEGFDTTKSFLKKAEERISSHDPGGAIAECRAAWKSVQPLLKENWNEIAAEIDRGSQQEEGYKPKSDRAMNLWNDMLDFSNTGSHPEYYAASMDDALLAYRSATIMLSYLSRKLVVAKRKASK